VADQDREQLVVAERRRSDGFQLLARTIVDRQRLERSGRGVSTSATDASLRCAILAHT
jgi:hypothetical protein